MYIPCRHERPHNGGWMEEQHFLIGGRQERVTIAPCMLLRPEAGRVESWLETLTLTLHRKIVHEFVLRQLLLQRYGVLYDFRSVGQLLRGLPVFYRYHSDRYYLLRDVVRMLPRVRRSPAGQSTATKTAPASATAPFVYASEVDRRRLLPASVHSSHP